MSAPGAGDVRQAPDRLPRRPGRPRREGRELRGAPRRRRPGRRSPPGTTPKASTNWSCSTSPPPRRTGSPSRAPCRPSPPACSFPSRWAEASGPSTMRRGSSRRGPTRSPSTPRRLATPRSSRASAARFGSQAVVVAIDAKREAGRFVVCSHSGRTATSWEAVEWAREAEARGAGRDPAHLHRRRRHAARVRLPRSPPRSRRRWASRSSRPAAQARRTTSSRCSRPGARTPRWPRRSSTTAPAACGPSRRGSANAGCPSGCEAPC